MAGVNWQRGRAVRYVTHGSPWGCQELDTAERLSAHTCRLQPQWTVEDAAGGGSRADLIRLSLYRGQGGKTLKRDSTGHQKSSSEAVPMVWV